jgi:methyl halide transferase
MKPRRPEDDAHIGRKEQEVDAAFWADRYQSRNTSWDQGAASPGLVDFLRDGRLKPGYTFVPGCGRGHDARALAAAGFQVVAADVVQAAVEEATVLAESEGLTIRYEQADFFNLPASLCGPYDLIFEHTFFCAIDPVLRERYVQIVAELLKPKGHLLGVFYHIQPESGPPFGCTRQELMERFHSQFSLLHEHVPRSFPNRQNEELLMLWQRR